MLYNLLEKWDNFKIFVAPILKNLDPSLLQNIILGILAISIPFAIVFLSDLLNPKKQRNHFEKMVLSEEVLGTTKIFWLSVFGIGILSFFSGTDTSITRKLIAVIFSLILIGFLWKPFKRILRFSEGYRPEFELRFLKKLKLSKIIPIGNELKMERMVRAWSSFWSEMSIHEREFTKVFIDHIDNTLYNKKYQLAISLAQSYKENLDKRNSFFVGYEILPKTFEWNEIFWKAEKSWLRNHSKKERIQNFFSKYFPTFKKWASIVLKKINSKNEFFWNWHYFKQEFFPALAKVLLFGGHESYQLFDQFKKHTDYIEIKISKSESVEDERSWLNYLEELFGGFCPVFFNNIDSAQSRYDIWHHYFPAEWKITAANSKKRIPRIILREFLEWGNQRLFRKNDEDYDKDLTEVINGIFPHVHHGLFPEFLMLLMSSDLKHVLHKNPNFFLINTGISWEGYKSDEEIRQMSNQQDKSQKEETISIIFDYFGNWALLRPYKEDMTEEEFLNWDNYSTEQRTSIINRVRKTKINKILDELESAEIKDMCGEYQEHRRKQIIELMELLLEKIS